MVYGGGVYGMLPHICNSSHLLKYEENTCTFLSGSQERIARRLRLFMYKFSRWTSLVQMNTTKVLSAGEFIHFPVVLEHEGFEYVNTVIFLDFIDMTSRFGAKINVVPSVKAVYTVQHNYSSISDDFIPTIHEWQGECSRYKSSIPTSSIH